jgi:hypothetical protein
MIRGLTRNESGIIVYGNYSAYLEIYNTKLSKSLTNGLLCFYSAAPPNPNSFDSCYLKHANVTFSEIEGYAFYITMPPASEGGYNALPTMGNDWWRWF